MFVQKAEMCQIDNWQKQNDKLQSTSLRAQLRLSSALESVASAVACGQTTVDKHDDDAVHDDDDDDEEKSSAPVVAIGKQKVSLWPAALEIWWQYVKTLM